MAKYSFESSGIVISSFIFTKTILYKDIIGVKKVNFFNACIAACNPFRPPMIGFPRGLTWEFILIETNNKRLTAITPKNCDKFVAELNERIEKAKI